MILLYILLIWLLPVILYLCYPIMFVYWTHKSLKTADEHFTIGDLFEEANKEFYKDDIYCDPLCFIIMPIVNWIMVFFLMKIDLEYSPIHDKYKNPIINLFVYIHKVIRFILYPIIYICKVISIGWNEVKKYICNIRII